MKKFIGKIVFSKLIKLSGILAITVILYFCTGLCIAFSLPNDDILNEELKNKLQKDYTICCQSWAMSWNMRNLNGPPKAIITSVNHGYICIDKANQICGPQPVSEKGHWQFSVIQVQPGSIFYLPYLAGSSKTHIWRIGARWEDRMCKSRKNCIKLTTIAYHKQL